MHRLLSVLLILLCLGTAQAWGDASDTQDTMYLIMVDRFLDGNPANNPPEPLYSKDRTQWKLYFGGDLAGITQKLGYLKQLGITTLWITPIVKNSDAVYHYNMQKAAGYHGYWASDFGAINPYFGTMPEFDKLVTQAHKLGIKIILDVVVNHTSPIDDGVDGAVYDGSRLLATYGKDPDKWFHHNGRIDFKTATPSDWQNRNLYDLADLNQDNPAVSDYLMRSFSNWVARGVDGIRIDTARHVSPQWLATFVAHMRQLNPSLYVVSEWSLGGADVPEAVDFANLTDSALVDFRLHDIVLDMFTHESANWQDLVFYLSHDHLLKHPYESLVYVDNHDVPRFMSEMTHNGSTEEEARDRTRAAVELIMTVRGIPCLYYDTEHLAHRDILNGGDPYNRAMMSSFDTSGPWFHTIQRLAELRRTNPALGMGEHVPRYISQDLYAFERKLDDHVVLVAINKGEPGKVTFKTSLPDGHYTETLSDGRQKVLGRDLDVVGSQATVQLNRWEVGIWSSNPTH